MLPLQIYCHLFYCYRGFNVVNKCLHCTSFFIPNGCISNYLDKKFTFHRDFYKVNCRNVYFKRISLFFHCNGVFLSHKDSHLEGNYESMSVLFFENVDRSFLLYQFYLKVFPRVIFNNLKKKILPILLKVILRIQEINKSIVARCFRKWSLRNFLGYL